MFILLGIIRRHNANACMLTFMWTSTNEEARAFFTWRVNLSCYRLFWDLQPRAAACLTDLINLCHDLSHLSAASCLHSVWDYLEGGCQTWEKVVEIKTMSNNLRFRQTVHGCLTVYVQCCHKDQCRRPFIPTATVYPFIRHLSYLEIQNLNFHPRALLVGITFIFAIICWVFPPTNKCT